jgi:Uma2 family endonuclease
MTSQTATKLTYDDYVAMPDDGRRYELIEGELVLNPAPRTKHQAISIALASAMYTHVKAHDAGVVYAAPTDVVLSPHNVVEPDIVFVSKERASIVTDNNVQGAPDLVVEIISDASRSRDASVKRRLYERFGVSEYWLFDPVTDTVRIYARSGDKFEVAADLTKADTLTTPLLPGLTIALADVFVER